MGMGLGLEACKRSGLGWVRGWVHVARGGRGRPYVGAGAEAARCKALRL